MLTVKTEISRALTKRIEAGKVTREYVEGDIATALAGALGTSIRSRVQARGDLAGQYAPEWDAVRRPKLVSSKYPDTAHGTPTKSGAELFRTSLEYHRQAGAKRGAYSVTGGMWAGLSRVVWSWRNVELRFRGRSDGQDARVINGKSRPLKVNNHFKAWTVFQQHNVNVLVIHDREFSALSEGTAGAVATRVGPALGVTWTANGPTGGIEEIYQRALGVRASIAANGAPL